MLDSQHAERPTASAGGPSTASASDQEPRSAAATAAISRKNSKALERFQQLRPALDAILAREGIPPELAAVVLVESGAQPLAISARHARGLWQLIPETARLYGLTVSPEIDERIQLETATRAAARYLRDLYAHFNDWPLALAAYNAGQSAVDRALRKGRGHTFTEMSASGLLPDETRKYVPAVLTTMRILQPKQSPVPAIAPIVYALTSAE